MKNILITATSPASLSNIGPAFDAMGLAIDNPCDIVRAQRVSGNEISFRATGLIDGLPANPVENVVVHVARVMREELRLRFGIDLLLEKRLPIGSGIGSSAASAAAAAVAVNGLLEKPLKRSDLLKFVIEGERFISGGTHGDNAAPALLGGAVIVRSCDPIDVVKLDVDKKFLWIVVNPALSIKTKEARAILPAQISLYDAVQQWANVGSLVHAMTTGDSRLLAASIDDKIIEPVRKYLIPGFDRVKHAAMKAGALACTISGSGPALFAVATSQKTARSIATTMQNEFKKCCATESWTIISRVNMKGTTVKKSIIKIHKGYNGIDV